MDYNFFSASAQCRSIAINFLSHFLTQTRNLIEIYMKCESLISSDSEIPEDTSIKLLFNGFMRTDKLKNLSLILERLQFIEELDTRWEINRIMDL